MPKVILAPMAGVSDLAFRRICLEKGADLTFTEMVSAKGLSYLNEKTQNLIAIAPKENSAAVQIFGHEADVMAKQALWIEETFPEKIACIDINMGCPARKIVSKGDGSALMTSPEKAAEIVGAVSSAVSLPVSVKFRRGYHLGDDTSLDFAKRMEQAGASAVTVHGRFAMQYYKGTADWGCIAKIKQALSIPVIGNGDITSGDDALRMLDETGCDHIMIARAAVGNPWIFEEIHSALGVRPEPFVAPDIQTRIDVMKHHVELLSALGDNAVIRMRKHAAAYVKGLPGASHMRLRLNQCTTAEDFVALFDEYGSSINNT